ncbi:MAG TPA: thiamine pyrophosphate-binding protein, partial [bacterium]|nr:thiamine pyrophosphate-binding protein [bacterium]
MALRETVADVLLETFQAVGIRYLFANLGTDYPPLVEALAKYQQQGAALPQVVLCPHEQTAISAAHGAFLASGAGQAVLVHVGVGTQNLGGALHQAWTARVPMVVFAGRTPATTRGERLGSRDNFIHFYQDVRDQAGVIRQFSKWECNLELPEQVAYTLQRAVRVMHSDPQGAVYLTAAREVLGMPANVQSDPPAWYATPQQGSLSPPDARRLAQGLREAQRPVIVTSYLGRQRGAVELLVNLSEALQVPVVESFPTHLNFPRLHANHGGFRAAPWLRDADLVWMVETDVPWVAKTGGPRPGIPIVQMDVDPVKAHMTLWDFPVTESHQVQAQQALAEVLAGAQDLPAANAAWREQRSRWLDAHRPAAPGVPGNGRLTVSAVAALLGQELPPEAVLVDEGVSNADVVRAGTRRTLPGTYFGTPGGSLGWGGGAALGHKLMAPQTEVACL